MACASDMPSDLPQYLTFKTVPDLVTGITIPGDGSHRRKIRSLLSLLRGWGDGARFKWEVTAHD